MIPELGHYALVLALAVALAQSVIPLVGASRSLPSWIAVARPAAIAQFGFVAYAFIALMISYVISDFSVINVAENSHTQKPMLYKVTGLWGNHEGSLVLWVLMLAGFGAAVAVFGGNLPPTLRARVLAVQAAIGVGFYLFILLTSNPFARLLPPPLEGRGLNPLLQDPGLAFHPPFLYAGYVGFSMAFSFAVAALIEGRVDPAWARWVRPWTLAAWCALTVGIALGSWWAYYELGWGGWWFWDPVENASFMPWLLGTALLHTAIVVEKRDALKSWTILLALLTFALSLLGTFLVRSGVLTSVHAFATDPERGVFILAFLVLVVGSSLVLYAIRAPSLKTGGLFQPISREGALILNNLLLATACATVFVGTMYPLFLDAVAETKVSVGAPYFNATFGPLMVPLIATMAIGPLLPWKRGDLGGALGRLKIAFAVTAAVALATLYFAWGGPVLAVFGMALAAWLIVGAAVEFADRIRLGRAPAAESWRRALSLPRASWGMSIAHAGMGLVVMGIVATSAWEQERLLIMKPGDRAALAGYDVTFLGTETIRGPNYMAARGRYEVSRAGAFIARMEPEQRSYPTPPMQTSEAAIRPRPDADIYIAIGEPAESGGWATRLYHKPLVHWIWFGSFVMVAGGLVSLTDRRHRVGAPARQRARAPAPSAQAAE
ncbi:MAG: heme lyase CcmF/NrfE family subunit [Alphaproteobacteria bacterium]|nr:heme lyase CcmF/NrfE family subunit [Alphaproteobacteria bacterium]